jgi:hypothetical protein
MLIISNNKDMEYLFRSVAQLLDTDDDDDDDDDDDADVVIDDWVAG